MIVTMTTTSAAPNRAKLAAEIDTNTAATAAAAVTFGITTPFIIMLYAMQSTAATRRASTTQFQTEYLSNNGW